MGGLPVDEDEDKQKEEEEKQNDDDDDDDDDDDERWMMMDKRWSKTMKCFFVVCSRWCRVF